MSDTPRTDSVEDMGDNFLQAVGSDFSRQLERELNAANERIRRLEQPITGETSDGYHTFNELYEHRHALFIALSAEIDRPSVSVWMSKKHADGSEIEGWFIAGIRSAAGDISYHIPMRLWNACEKSGARILSVAPKWDGHTSKDVIERLMRFATE